MVVVVVVFDTNMLAGIIATRTAADSQRVSTSNCGCQWMAAACAQERAG